jgi:hypothetical protein
MEINKEPINPIAAHRISGTIEPKNQKVGRNMEI